MRAAVLSTFVLVCATGCAREARPPAPPAYHYPVAAYGWASAFDARAPMPEPRYAALAGSAAPAPSTAPSEPAPRPDVPLFSSAELASGETCIAELAERGVSFKRLGDKRGVVTPVEVSGKLGGIRYRAGAGHGFVADCRFVLALERVAPVLAELGVTEMRFSGAYSYRMSRVGKLSLHAHGLALDVHEVQFGTTWQAVERDFSRGHSDGCGREAPLLNQMACRLRATRMFRELLTPDYDWDHRNHFHLGLAPLAGQEAPKPAPAKTAAPKAPAAKSAPRHAELDALPPGYEEPTVEPEPPAPAKPAPKVRSGKRAKPTHPARHRPAKKEPVPTTS